MKRIHSIDTLKGVGVAALVFLHCAVYSYGSLDSVDIRNPPLFIAVIGVMATWGGLFALMSGAVNAFRFAERGQPRTGRLFLTGLCLLGLHLLYNLLAAPTSLDFETYNHQYTLIPGLFRLGHLQLSPRRMVEGTALLMLAANLMLLSIFLPLVGRRKNPVAWCAGLTVVFLAAGLARFVVHPVYREAVDTGQYLVAFALSPFASNPYPVFPYFGFACAGAAFGFAQARDGRAPRFSGAAGLAAFAAGLAGVLLLPTNLHEISAFWYARVVLELGVFLLILWLLFRIGGQGKERRLIFQRAARMSLTVFCLQTPLAEALTALLTALAPGWNRTIGVTMLFAAGNVLIWLGVVWLWSRAGYRITLEHFWVRVFQGSTKLEGIRQAGPARGS